MVFFLLTVFIFDVTFQRPFIVRKVHRIVKNSKMFSINLARSNYLNISSLHCLQLRSSSRSKLSHCFKFFTCFGFKVQQKTSLHCIFAVEPHTFVKGSIVSELLRIMEMGKKIKFFIFYFIMMHEQSNCLCFLRIQPLVHPLTKSAFV